MLELVRAHRHHGQGGTHVARRAAALGSRARGAAPLHQRVVHERLQQGQQGLATSTHGAQDMFAGEAEYALWEKRTKD